MSLVFPSTAVPNGTVLEFFESADSAAHDLKGDALHALWRSEGMLLAGAAQYAGGLVRVVSGDYLSRELFGSATLIASSKSPRALICRTHSMCPSMLLVNSRA